jgi:hypothetical protein
MVSHHLSDPTDGVGWTAANRVLYELGVMELGVGLYPVYAWGEAYLGAHQGGSAAAEFQKILDHACLVQNGQIGALAHLGLARAYALSGDTVKARAAYQDFLALWKDADPDMPILKEAKAEYCEAAIKAARAATILV